MSAPGDGSFVVDVLFEDQASEVLQLPVLRPKAARKLLSDARRSVPILGSGQLPTTEDTLEQFLQHAGNLFGKDPSKWEKVGEPTTDITEQDGKRIIKRTGMYTGTELHLVRLLPYYDPRLPLRPDQPSLEFAVQQQEITSTQEWQQLLVDQPLTASRRRQLQYNFLQAKLEAEDEQLLLEGARGMWELSINKQHHAELELHHLRPVVNHLQCSNIEVSRMCAATVWGLAVNEQSRTLLLQLGVVEVLLSVARHSLTMQCICDQELLPGDYVAGGKCSQTQRNHLQACVLGALSVLIVDRACRQPLIAAEPSCATLFELSSNLEGYEDRVWAATRREAAAKAITSLLQRDHDARTELMMMGGINQVLAQLEAKGPGHSKVQYCMASLLATVVLDEQAMEVLRQRGEGHLVFEATLKLLNHVLNGLKFTLAVPGAQILSEGMTQAEVQRAMEHIRNSTTGGDTQGHGGSGVATPLMQAAARRLSQETALTSDGSTVAAARRMSAEAAAAVLQEASHLGKQQQQSLADDEQPEPLDVHAAVSLAEACAQAVWGSAYYSLDEPLHVTQAHVVELGKISLDCLIIGELDLGRVCHCLAATLASMASNETVAGFIMSAPGDTVAKALLTLLEVEDEPGFSNAGHVRAAASTCLAFLACHPLGAKGDGCLWGPFRTQLLAVGTLGVLLRAALTSSSDDPCNNIIQQTAAVGIMYLTTMAGAVDAAELAMYAALMTSTNVHMVEFLMAGCWLLLKNPTNRQVLGNAFNANPASTKLAQGMMQKLQDTVEVADVTGKAETLMKARPAGSACTANAGSRMGSSAGNRPGSRVCTNAGASRHASATPQHQHQQSSSGPEEEGVSAAGAAPPAPAATRAQEGGVSGDDAAQPAGVESADAQQPAPSSADGSSAGSERFEFPDGDVQAAAAEAAAAEAAAVDAPADSRPGTSSSSFHAGGLLGEASFGALAAEADSMEDKLKLVETKRRSVLIHSLAGGGDGGDHLASPSSTSGGGRMSGGGGGGVGRVKELSQSLQEDGPDSRRTLDTCKSIGSRSLSRGLNNLDEKLGSELHDNWGLDVLVRVGETWLPKLRDASGIPAGGSMGGSNAEAAAAAAAGDDSKESEAKADIPLLKLFEFLTASLCLYVIEEASTGCPLRRKANLFSTGKVAGSDGCPSWWTVDAPMVQSEPALSPLMLRAMHILLTLLQLRLPAAWKSMQLSVVMLWNAAVQSGSAESHQVREGICSTLLEQVNSRMWPPTLRDMAAGHLQFLMETYTNLVQLGQEWQRSRTLDEARQRREAAAARLQAECAKSGAHSSKPRDSFSPLSLSGSSSHNNKPAAAAASTLNPLPFDLAALLNPTAAAAAAAAGKGHGQGAKQQQDPTVEALKAAGGHPGLVPVLSCYVGLMRTGHQLLELRGASGIARMCFAAALGAPCASKLLAETKATAAAVGAIGALVDVLRMSATKFMVLEDGGHLPPQPVLSQLVDKEYNVYQRDINNKSGVLEVLTAVLAALLNLSTLVANQPKLAKRGLLVLLKTNSSLFQVISCRDARCESEMRLLDMLAAILQNLASHPDNRTCMYRAELAGTTALDRVLEGPCSPEPIESSAALLAGRITAKIAGPAAGRCSSSSPMKQAAAAGHSRSGSPVMPQPGRCESPTFTAAARRQTQGTDSLSKSIDTALSAHTVVRPKVLFPPISRSTAGMLAASGGTREQWIRAGSPPRTAQQPQQQQQQVSWPSPPASPTATAAAAGGGGGGRASPSRQGPRFAVSSNPPHTATGARGATGHGRSPARNSSLKSRAATSMAGVPGSPMSAPDSREQFLIWMDSTFVDPQGGYGDNSGGSAEPWNKANHQGSSRRPLFDPQTGEWLQPEPEATPALQQLLCRPLKHLWQDSPESRARNARWAPAVSEYRQAALQYPLQHAAEAMLTTEPPEQVEQLQSATTTFTATGRLDGSSCSTGVSLERPSTAQRDRGRVPLTVLAGEQQQAGPAEVTFGQGSPSSSSSAAAAAATTARSASSRAQGAATSRSDSNSSSWQQHHQQQPLQHPSIQQMQAQSSSSAALKVVLSPQRPRTIISFENRCWSSDGLQSRPVLTMFPHTEGAKVSEGLFTEYQLPNGRTAFLYYNAGTAMDEAEFAPVQPPERPTTVPLALQQSMPLAQVMSLIAKPPGTGPPYRPYKPVPRLVPLPGSHTLTVLRPELRTAESYGQLRPDNLQLVLKAEAIMKSQTTTTEEDIRLPVAEQREPWTLPGSIFKPRVKESDARQFYDGGATLEKLFSRDWARACGKEKFTSMLSRENKGNASGKSDKVAMQEVHDMLKKHYQLVYSAFMYYATGGNDPYHMPLNSFTSFLDDAAIPDPDSLSIKRSDCDTIFIVCNFQPDKSSPDVAVNDEHAMMRFEFLEAIVRLALAKYGKGQSTDDLALAVELMFERNLNRLVPQAQLVCNDFRTERLYTEEVDLLFKQHQAMLKSLYSRYRLKPNGGGLRPKVLKLDGWLALMSDARLIDSQFTLVDATLAFLWSRMFVIDEIKDYVRYTSLSFIDFLEALGRVADAKSMPTASDLDAAGYPSILQWALDKERMEGASNSNNAASNGNSSAANAASSAAAAAGGGSAGGLGPPGSGVPTLDLPTTAAAASGGANSSLPEIFRSRPSARFGAPKPRPLYAKLDLLLDLVFRRLHWDPAQPEVAFSYDGLQRMIKKVDKELGP